VYYYPSVSSRGRDNFRVVEQDCILSLTSCPTGRAQRRCQYVRLLRTGCDRYASNKKCGHAAHALRAGVKLIGGYLACAEIAAQQFLHAGGVEAALCSDSRQDAWAPHIFGIDKISSKQIFYNRILHNLRDRPAK
jgi:hypothetical protein